MARQHSPASGRFIGQRLVADLQHEVVALTRRDGQREEQLFAVAAGPGSLGTAPTQMQIPDASGPDTSVAVQVPHRVLVVAAARLHGDRDRRGSVDGPDLPQQDRAMWLGGVDKGVAAFDDPGASGPAVAPDHRCVLVVATPNAGVLGSDGVAGLPADEGAEHRVAVPAGHAHPDDVATGPDHGATLAVGEKRVLPQDVRGKLRRSRGLGRFTAGRRRPGRCHGSRPATEALRTADRAASTALAVAVRR